MTEPANADWLALFRRYLAATTLANLAWEFLHMPLYTLGTQGTLRQIIAYGLHCTAGDVMIAALALLGSLLLLGSSEWPWKGFWRVALAAILAGLAYTAYSEWLNVYVRRSWAYSPAMPMLPGTGIGASPILQWLIVPTAAFWWLRPRQN